MIELSVVIPSRDAGPRLARCLEALAQQADVDGRFEVIVVDDGSLPAVDPALRAPGGRFPVQVVRRDVAGGVAVGRNAGWRLANGRICLFLDDDIVVDPRLVANHLAAHGAPEPVAGIGRLTTHLDPGADWLMQRFAEMWNEDVAVLDAGRSPRAVNCYGGNLSVATELLRELDGFDEAFPRSEDVELGARLVERGVRLAYVPGANEHREHKAGRQVLAGARANGRQAGRLVEAHPWLLEQTELGTYAIWGQRHLAARRLLSRLRVRPELLLPLASLLGGGRAARSALVLLLHLAYWAGVRDATRRADFDAMTDGTAILMYHGFSPPGSRPSRFVTPIDRFEAQIQGLLRRGHRPIRLSDYLAHRQAHRFPPARSFVVTIDDAYAEIEPLVGPLLRRLGVPVTIFVVEAGIGARNDWDTEGPLAGRPTLDAAALERLRADGVELAPHSSRHPRLAGLAGPALADEIAGATARLSVRFGPLLQAFAYPYGSADEAARAAVTGAGLVGVGVDEGLACPASPADYLPRIEVHGGDSPARVALAARIGGTRSLLRR